MKKPLHWQLRMMMALALLMLANNALAWSALGHSTIAELAERHLTPAAKAQIAVLLADEPTPHLAAIASWADQLRHSDPARFRATSRWHYVNYSEGSCQFDRHQHCRNGDCIIAAIEQQLAILADLQRPLPERRDALKFVVHLVGDIHQPMHAGNRNDAGGNRFQISLRTQQAPPAYARQHYRNGVMGTNLHAVWDDYIPGSHQMGYRAYADALQQPHWPPLATPQGTPEQWAMQSCQLLDAWGIYPQSHSQDDAYLLTMRPLVDRRIRQAGLRLAHVLNQALSSPTR